MNNILFYLKDTYEKMEQDPQAKFHITAELLSEIIGLLEAEGDTMEHELVYPPSDIKYIVVPNVDGSAVRYIREDLCEELA